MNKEIINNANKLRVEPQKMKRKNILRKSLAWNSAFFTEEGVLDPLELSLLSRSLGTPSRNSLSVIPEGVHLPELPASTVNEEGPASRRKVVSVNDVNQSASKRGGCPQPVALSSRKIKPPDTNVAKVKRKESKVSALLAPKLDPSCVSTSKRSSTASSSHLKHNQFPQPAGDGQKNIRSNGASIDNKHAQNEMKPCASATLITKSTPHHVRRKVSPVRKLYSSTNERHLQVDKGNFSLLPAGGDSLNAYDCNSSKIAVLSLQNACNNGGDMQYIQPQTAKSSCLRMPSPSLGFFSQSKPSSSPTLLEITQTCKLPESNIPSLPKVGISDPIHRRPPQPSMISPQSSNMGCYVASVVNPTSNRNIKFKLELNNKEKLVRAPYTSRTYDRLSNGKQLHDIHYDKSLLPGGPCEQLKKDGHKERATDFCLKGRGVTADGSDHPHFSSSESLHVEVEGVLEKVSSAANDYTEDREYIPTIKNLSGYSEFHTLHMKNYSDDRPKTVNDQLSSMQEFNKQPVEKANLMKLDTCQNDPVSNMENLTLRINNGSSFEERSSEELNKCSSSSTADDFQDCRASELEIAYGSCCNNILYANNESSGIDTLYDEVHMGDPKVQSIEGHQLVESGERSILPASVVVDNPPLMLISNPSEKAAEHAELPVPCLATGQCLNNNCGLPSEFCLLNGNKFSSEGFKEKNAIESGNEMISEVNACGGELKNSSVLNSPANQDAAKKAEGLDLETLVASVDCDKVKVASAVKDRSLREGAADKCESSVKNFNAFSYFQLGNNSDLRGTPMLQNNCSASIMGNIAHVRATTGSGLKSICGIHQHEVIEEINELAEVEVLSLDASSLSDSCNASASTLVENKNSSIMVDDCGEQPEEHPVVQNPHPGIGQDPQENHEWCSDGNLFVNISSVEMQDREALPHVIGFVLEQGDDFSSKSKCSDICIQVPPVIKDAGLDVDKKAEQMFMVHKVPHSIEIVPSAESIKCSMDGKNRSDDELIDQASSMELSPSSNKSGHQTSLLANNCDAMSFYSLNEKPELLVETKESSSQRILLSVEVYLSDGNTLPEKAEIKIPHATGILSSELHDELHVMCPAQDKDAKLSLQKSVNEKKQATCLIKPPPNAVPFSDEWLAALEAAGEEILTMKGGAVQNSPTDKLQPEPGPWSPVQRKNARGIGPYDCTKFTNNQQSTTK